MKIQYLTNIMDPVLKSPEEFRKKIRTVLVSEKYYRAFDSKKYSKKDFSFLLSDNGNFTRLNVIAKKHEAEAEALKAKAILLTAKGNALPASIKDERTKLNQKIIDECNSELLKIDYKKITSNQLTIEPDGIIGAEDTTIPILQICGAFDPIFRGTEPSLSPFQRNTLKLYTKQCSGAYGGEDKLPRITKYLVLHATDYNSMVKAAKKVKKKKFDGIAVSLGGPLAKKGYISQITAGRKVIKFSNSHPESYISTVMLLLALRNNISSSVPVHVLGLGTPILILLSSYIFMDFKHITIDSTATYKDVEVNCIYGNKNGLYKMDLSKLAAYCIVNNSEFKGISPYYKSFVKKFPSHWKKLSEKFITLINDTTISKDTIQKKIRSKLVAKPSLYLDSVPFFAPITIIKKKMKSEVRIARSFENYWVNNSLCKKLSTFRSKSALKKYILNEISKFEKFGAKNYVDAIKESIKLIDTIKK